MDENLIKQKDNIWDFKSFPELDYIEKDYFYKHKKIFEYVSKNIQSFDRDSKILDIGCSTGIGFGLPSIKERKNIYGVDYIESFINVFNARGMNGSVSNIMKDPLPYENDSFDIVVCAGIIEHTLDPKRLLEEAERVMKKNGLLIIVFPNAISLRARIDFLRGRNNFRPLIDNILNLSYLKRCSIFYSIRELKMVLENSFQIKEIKFIQEKRDKTKLIYECLLKTYTFLFPKMRDVVFAIVNKKQLDY